MFKARKYLAEAVGTFCLVFAGTAAIAANDVSGGKVTSLGIGLVFGLIVLAMIYAIGHISGAHMNPAVTLAFMVVSKLKPQEGFIYWIAQLVGALLASCVVHAIFPTANTIGVTLPVGSWQQSFILEFVLSFLLMFVIMGVAHDERAEGMMAGVAIGATVALEAILGGPISGASMNPVRSLAPAVVSGNLHSLWIYCLAPMLGMVAGSFLYQAVKYKEA
jgi:MIP family channel proteins